jgi:hypothetical protein
MMPLILHILTTVVVYLLMAGVYLGVGLLVLRLAGFRACRVDDLGVAPWVGWCGGIVILQIWHFVAPINAGALAVTVAVGASGLLVCREEWTAIQRALPRGKVWFAVCWVGGATWVAAHASTQPKLFDAGFYHFQSLQWLTHYAIVPSLGNLSPMLSGNHSFFLYGALFDVGPFSERPHHVISGVLIVLGLHKCLIGFWQVLASEPEEPAGAMYDSIFLILLVYLAIGPYGFASTPSPDLAIYLLGIVASSELFKLVISAKDRGPSGADSLDAQDTASRRGFITVLVCSVAVSVKLSFIATGSVFIVFAVAVYVVSGRRSTALIKTTGVRSAIAGCLVMIPWAVRGVITSGYVAYPLTIGGVDVDWKIPEELVQQYAEHIRAVARSTSMSVHQSLSGWAWFKPWLRRMVTTPFDFEIVSPILLTLASVLSYRISLRPWRRRHAMGAWWFLLAPLLGMIFWFIAAPDPRFAGAVFWVMAAAAVTLTTRSFEIAARRLITCLVTVLIFSLSIAPVDFLTEWRRDYGAIRSAETEKHLTTSGLEIRVPRNDARCWNAPLPCTPYFDPRLRQRVPGDLSKGFILDQNDDAPTL